MFSSGARSHIDAVRASLSQFYLQSDVVALARIDAVADRTVTLGEETVVFEVVTATVLEFFKGDPPVQVDIYPDAHGPPHYLAGDVAVLFLERPDLKHTLHKIAAQGDLDYISRQTRNSEHVLKDAWRDDYRWVLQQYARSDPIDTGAAAETSGVSGVNAPAASAGVKRVLLRMLDSNAPALVESALIDWQTTGVRFDAADVAQLVDITHAPGKPINLRLSILRTLASQGMVGAAAWDPLFTISSGRDLVAVVRSTQGFERRDFQHRLQGFLKSDDDALVEVAARALGHPTYSGSEDALSALLERPDLRLNYAAVAGLLGIHSSESSAILRREALEHPNKRVRRIIDAKLIQAGG